MTHRITFLPQHRTASTPDGASILSAANWAGIPIETICGGRGTCGQCKVRMREGAGPAAETDRRFLDAAQLEDGWRLACCATVHADCVVEAPSGSSEPPVALPGSGRSVALDPNVCKVHLELAQPSLADPRSYLTRVLDALRAAGYEPRAVPNVSRALPAVLRHGAFDITAVICGDEWIAVEAGDTTDRNYGLALDLGTTTVVGTLVNLKTGVIEAVESLLNAQATYGADVIARIGYATLHEGGLAALQSRIAGTVNQLVEAAGAKCGVPRENIYEAVAVGNATMLHLLLGVDPAPIGVSPFVPAFQQALTLPAADAGLRLHPEARLSTLPLVGAYVGADVVAGLLATDGVRRADGKLRLYLDVGTNTEIVLGRDDRYLATAAPAGPAFEGAQIRCGMRAASGAIEGLAIDGNVWLRIVGGLPRPVGICGSGLVDAVAELLRCGLLEPSGRFVRPDAVPGRLTAALADRLILQDGIPGFLLSAPEDGIILTQADVRALQLAKAAIASGTQVLMKRLGVRTEDLDEVLLAGSFGSYLNPASARAIGLVPDVPLERITAVGNAAGEGAKIALLSRAEREAARQMPQHVEPVELSGHPQFNSVFTDALALGRA